MAVLIEIVHIAVLIVFLKGIIACLLQNSLLITY